MYTSDDCFLVALGRILVTTVKYSDKSLINATENQIANLNEHDN